MRPQFFLAPLTAVLGLMLGIAPGVRAEVVRFRYVPADAAGTMTPASEIPGAAGVRSSWYGGARQPLAAAPPPNMLVTFRHPHTGRNVIVPMILPDSTPRIEHRPGSVVFNYGSYTIETIFYADGSVETVYNSGYGRPMRFQ